MNIFIIPSWYPSVDEPHTGIFFKEQALIYAKHFPEDHLGIGHWGPNIHDTLFEISKVHLWPTRFFRYRRLQTAAIALASNCTEYFQPSRTWTRRLQQGNIEGHVAASLKSIKKFEADYGKVDVIHGHVAYPAGYVAMRLSQTLDIPYMITEHMGPFPFPSFQKGGRPEAVLLEPLQKAKKVLSVSENLQHTLAGLEVKSDVFPNFIEESDFQLEAVKRGVFTFLHVGRLSPEKGQDVLIEAVSKLTDEFQLILVGDGPLKGRLQRLVRDLGLSANVQFKGVLSRHDVSHELRKADAFVLPSRYENFPVAVMEALAAGLPVIASRVGGLSQMITKINGRLVKAQNDSSLAEAMQFFLDGKTSFDQEEIRKDFISRFGSKEAVRRLRSYYEALL